MKTILVLFIQLIALQTWASTKQTLDVFNELRHFIMKYDKLSASSIRTQLKVAPETKSYEMIYVTDLLNGEESFVTDSNSNILHYNNSFEFNIDFGFYEFKNINNQHADSYLMLIYESKIMVYDSSSFIPFLNNCFYILDNKLSMLSESQIINVIKRSEIYKSEILDLIQGYYPLAGLKS